MNIINEILDFYKEKSLYTDLGLYKEFAKKLPDDIKKLCELQRNQIIHPASLQNSFEKDNSNSFYGDMTKVPKTSLVYENDLYPTAIAIISELLRRDPIYHNDRRVEDKLHLCCREQSILLASILKEKGYAARVRSGFASYVSDDSIYYDHWITEYYDISKKRWILVDADQYIFCIFDFCDLPRDQFVFGAEAYLGLRNGKYKDSEFVYSSDPPTLGIKASLRGLFYDFHSLMNDEIFFLHVPKYIADKEFILTEEEYQELDYLASLMINPDQNFHELLKIWNQVDKFRIMSGGMNS